VCAFVAVGTDIIHQHPSFDAGLTGEGSLRDFHLLVQEVRGLNREECPELWFRGHPAGGFFKGIESGP